MDLNLIVVTQGLVAWVVVVFAVWRSFPRPSKIVCLILAVMFTVYGVLALIFWTYGFILSAVASSYCMGSYLHYYVDERNAKKTERFLDA